MKSKAERLSVFYARLLAAHPASSHEEGIALVREVLNKVEDEMTNIAYSSPPHRSDGRMYPPLDDYLRIEKLGNNEVFRYRSASHNTIIGKNGAIRIQTVPISLGGKVIICLNKSGADGFFVDGMLEGDI
jgi:hypothetical protein